MKKILLINLIVSLTLILGIYKLDKVITRLTLEPYIDDFCNFKDGPIGKHDFNKKEVMWDEETSTWEFGSNCTNIFGEPKMIPLKRDADVCEVLICKDNIYYTHSYSIGNRPPDTKFDIEGPYTPTK